MITKQTIHEADKRARRWLALYVLLVVGAAFSVVIGGWVTAICFAVAVVVGIIYLLYTARALDAYEDAADELGIETPKHHHVDGRSLGAETRRK